MNVPFYRHGLGPDDANAVADVLSTPFLTSAGKGKEVEAQLREFFDVPHAKLTNSWTNGSVAVLLALDIGPGDEVIVPAMTFIATANVVELVGATPIFVDVDPDTLLLRPEDVAAAITERTRAVIPVHLYGQMLDMAALRAAVGPDIAIIEDCAHAFEATFDGERPGTHSDAALFSFYATKNVTCGEGGACITRREDLFETLKVTLLHGMSAGAADRFKQGGYRHWDMLRLGTKANLPDLLAALLPTQIARVERVREQRESLCRRYEAAFAELSTVRLAAVDARAVSARHLFPIHVGSGRDRALKLLSEHGVGATVNYNPPFATTFYRDKYGIDDSRLPVSADWGWGVLSLPLFPSLTETEQDHVIHVVRDVIHPALQES